MNNRREPWPHQQEIVELARYTNIFLADDTGAGKTISAIEAAHLMWTTNAGTRRLSAGVQPTLPSPILIICVKSAKLQWLAEIIKQYPGEPVWMANKGDKQLFQDARRKNVWIIAHYHVFHDIDLYHYVNRQLFACIVVDEAHRIKGHTTAWAKRIRNLKARRKIAATATPQEHSVADMYNILHFLDPSRWTSYWKFVEKYCLTEDSMFSDNPTVIGTNPATFPELAKRLAPFYRRRMKSDVRDDMPDLIEESVPILMEPAQEKLYKAIEESDDIVLFDPETMSDELILANKLSLLIRLWQAATFPKTVPGSKVEKSAKLLWLDDYISDNPTENLLIFTWFRDTAIHIAEKYSTLPAFVGGHKNRLPTPDDRIVVGTIGSMGESLDLPWISTAIFMNRSRSTIQMKQAKDRIYRMTITETKFVKYLEAYHTNGTQTIDHMIEKSLRNKWTDAQFVTETIKSIQSHQPANGSTDY